MSNATTKDLSNPLQQFISYPFSSDPAYQQGLASILQGGALEGKPEEEKEDLLRRSRVFYFNRITQSSLTVEETREYERSLPNSEVETASAPSTSSSKSTEERVLTFAELKELIESGKTDQIPNNKVIPDATSDEPPSESKATPRKKPWE